MSEKTADTSNKKRLFKVLKWGGIAVGITALELAGIFSAVKIIESKNLEKDTLLQNVQKQLQTQSVQISDLERIPSVIASNAEKIAANTGMANLLAEKLNALKEEVGNKKMELMNTQISQLNHRVEVVEENKSQEALILSLALLIKENALYNRSFAKEADILAELSQGQENIMPDVHNISALKDTTILSDTKLIEQYKKISEDFIFSDVTNAQDDGEKENRGAVARSIELIKDTVSGINFDKVVVMKKEKKTDEQQLLLNTLTELVNTHNFKDAAAFIEQNRTAFHEELNPEFAQWFERLNQKVTFDRAISQIIAAELSAIRQDIADSAVKQTTHKDNVND